jgi:hypothetical protein
LIYLLVGFINLNLGVFLGLYIAEIKIEREYPVLGPTPEGMTLIFLSFLSFSGVVFIVCGLFSLDRRSKDVA